MQNFPDDEGRSFSRACGLSRSPPLEAGKCHSHEEKIATIPTVLYKRRHRVGFCPSVNTIVDRTRFSCRHCKFEETCSGGGRFSETEGRLIDKGSFAGVRGTTIIRRTSGRPIATTTIPIIATTISAFGGLRPSTPDGEQRASSRSP